MLRQGYIARQIVAMLLMGCGLILGWEALQYTDSLFLLLGFMAFGIGSGIAVYVELKRLVQQGMG